MSEAVELPTKIHADHAHIVQQLGAFSAAVSALHANGDAKADAAALKDLQVGEACMCQIGRLADCHSWLQGSGPRGAAHGAEQRGLGSSRPHVAKW